MGSIDRKKDYQYDINLSNKDMPDFFLIFALWHILELCFFVLCAMAHSGWLKKAI